MKLSTLFLICFLSFGSLFAQSDKFGLQLKLGIPQTIILINDVSNLDFNKESRVGFNISAKIEYPLSRQWILYSSLNYFQQENDLTFNKLIFPEDVLEQTVSRFRTEANSNEIYTTLGSTYNLNKFNLSLGLLIGKELQSTFQETFFYGYDGTEIVSETVNRKTFFYGLQINPELVFNRFTIGLSFLGHFNKRTILARDYYKVRSILEIGYKF